jgi:peptide/nickel transport system substrate-binding protein
MNRRHEIRSGRASAPQSRRRLLRTVLMGGAAAAFAAACTGDDKPEEGTPAAGDAQATVASGLLAERKDTTGEAKRGGTFRDWILQDAIGLDPNQTGNSGAVDIVRMVYSRLMMFEPGYMGKPSTRNLVPDAAESLEISPDKLQFTYKLRPNVTYDPRPPTSGRTLDAQDVLYAWSQFEARHQARGELSNKVAKAAPITAVEAPDARTVVFKLAFPMATALPIMNSTQRLLLIPREADGGFDIRQDARGSSAWTLTEYRPSAYFTFARNPKWYRQDRPFIDGWEMPIVSEYAQRLAQMRAGGIFAAPLRTEDILQTKRDVPVLDMYADEWSDSYFAMQFGLKGNSPFKDQRVRQAVSMLLDRQTLIDVFQIVDDFKKAGLPVETRWYTHAGVKPEEGWLDPQDQGKFGSAAKYYQYDVAEAKKLLAAAGYPNGFSTETIYSSTGQANYRQFDAVAAMLAEGGIKTKTVIWENTTEYVPRVLRGKADYEGIAFGSNATSFLPLELLFRRAHSGGTNFIGFDPNGANPAKGDPRVDSLIEAARQEYDIGKQNAIVHDLQRYLAEQMYNVPWAGEHPGFRLVWPAVRNWGVYTTGSAGGHVTEVLPHLWLDPARPPLGRGP